MSRRDPSRCLRFRWSKAERDFVAHYPTRKADANMLLHTFVTWRNMEGRTFIEELEFRGFDAKRMLFSVPAEGEAVIWLLLIPLAPLAVIAVIFCVVKILVLSPCELLAEVFAPHSRAARWFEEVLS